MSRAELVEELEAADADLVHHTAQVNHYRALRTSLLAKLAALDTHDAPTPPEPAEAQPEPDTEPVELRPLPPLVSGERRYQRVIIDRRAIPANRTVWVLDTVGHPSQAHLHTGEPRAFQGITDCGLIAEAYWWRPEITQDHVELCHGCALKIPGTPQP